MQSQANKDLWHKIYREYCTGYLTFQQLADKHCVGYQAVRYHGKNKNWSRARKDYRLHQAKQGIKKSVERAKMADGIHSKWAYREIVRLDQKFSKIPADQPLPPDELKNLFFYHTQIMRHFFKHSEDPLSKLPDEIKMTFPESKYVIGIEHPDSPGNLKEKKLIENKKQIQQSQSKKKVTKKTNKKIKQPEIALDIGEDIMGD